MKWKDIFEDPDMVGQTEYLAIHEAIATTVMGTESPDPEQKISCGKQQQIAEMLEEIGSQTRHLSEALSKRLPIKTYWRPCECGKVLVVTERDDRRASGGKSLEFDWKKDPSQRVVVSDRSRVPIAAGRSSGTMAPGRSRRDRGTTSLISGCRKMKPKASQSAAAVWSVTCRGEARRCFSARCTRRCKVC